MLAGGTLLGLAGIDLILPAIPGLPDVLGGTAAQAQWVLASYTLGAALGLLFYGELGARFSQRRLLVFSLIGFALTSWLAASAGDIKSLIALRFVQGLSGAAAAVFAPGMIRALFDDKTSVRAFGLIGSLESLTPALAPVLGAWLLTYGDWALGLDLIALGSGLLALLAIVLINKLPSLPIQDRGQDQPSARDAYNALVQNWQFMGTALSHAFNLGGLLVFVFSAPAVIVTTMDGSISDFITMQIAGITCFIIATNSAQKVSESVGRYRQIWIGGWLSLVGGLAILALSFTSAPAPLWLAFLFPLVNVGLGLRGPLVFNAAIAAAGQQSARGSALLALSILMAAALGTAAVAPFIDQGLVAPALGLTVFSILALVSIPRHGKRRKPQG